MSQNVKIWDRDAIIELLDTNTKALARSVLTIYAAQTLDEQAAGETKEHNGVGFSGRDAAFLSSIAQALPRYNMNMTPKQIAKVRPLMKRYWRQLLVAIEAKGGQVCYKRSVSAESPQETAAETTQSQAADAAVYGIQPGAWA